MRPIRLSLAFSILALAACNAAATDAAVESGNGAAAPAQSAGGRPFAVQNVAQFQEPWAMAFIPGTGQALITERKGRLLLWNDGGRVVEVSGAPRVDDGGQGGVDMGREVQLL